MPKCEKSVLIVDLDNTLYDWVRIWHASFRVMLDEIVNLSQVPEGELIKHIRKIHQKAGTSEYSFLIEDLASYIAKNSREDFMQKMQPAIDVYRRERRNALYLYPTVRETLETIKRAGTRIVGFTDSLAFYSMYRLKRLNLDGTLDYLFSPPDHDFPAGVTKENVRSKDAEAYELAITTHRVFEHGIRKPDPRMLDAILSTIHADREQCVYVGDSLFKDVEMAQKAGILDVYAMYGYSQERPEYELLQAVSHWTDEDVARERELKTHHVNPTIVLESEMKEILKYISFVSWR